MLGWLWFSSLAVLAPGLQDGVIHWDADLATAKALSAKDGRPVIAYFTFET